MANIGQTKHVKRVYNKLDKRTNRITFKCTTHEKNIIHALSIKYGVSVIGLLYTAFPNELQELSEMGRGA